MDAGKTNDPMQIWSGDTLMDLSKNTALKITPKQIAGKRYLFIEAGGFNDIGGWVIDPRRSM